MDLLDSHLAICSQPLPELSEVKNGNSSLEVGTGNNYKDFTELSGVKDGNSSLDSGIDNSYTSLPELSEVKDSNSSLEVGTNNSYKPLPERSEVKDGNSSFQLGTDNNYKPFPELSEVKDGTSSLEVGTDDTKMEQDNAIGSAPIKKKKSCPPAFILVLRFLSSLNEGKGASVEDICRYAKERYFVNMITLKNGIDKYLRSGVRKGFLQKTGKDDKEMYRIMPGQKLKLPTRSNKKPK